MRDQDSHLEKTTPLLGKNAVRNDSTASMDSDCKPKLTQPISVLQQTLQGQIYSYEWHTNVISE